MRFGCLVPGCQNTLPDTLQPFCVVHWAVLDIEYKEAIERGRKESIHAEKMAISRALAAIRKKKKI